MKSAARSYEGRRRTLMGAGRARRPAALPESCRSHSGALSSSSGSWGRDETCPVSTRGGTRLVQLVREGRGGGCDVVGHGAHVSEGTAAGAGRLVGAAQRGWRGAAGGCRGRARQGAAGARADLAPAPLRLWRRRGTRSRCGRRPHSTRGGSPARATRPRATRLSTRDAARETHRARRRARHLSVGRERRSEAGGPRRRGEGCAGAAARPGCRALATSRQASFPARAERRPRCSRA